MRYFFRDLVSFASHRRTSRQRLNLRWLISFLLVSCGLSWALVMGWVVPSLAQSTPATPAAPAARSTSSFTLPKPPTTQPTVAAGNPGQYVLEFNRSPVVGNRFRLEGIYDEARLRFTRPQSWKPKTIKLLLRYRHSGALYATRSNLTVLINGTSVGSIPLNKPQGKIGEIVFPVPLNLVQDYNELVIAALQNNSPTCTQDPFDPSLWTEVLPDSKLLFDFEPQPIALNFNRYPYPVFDNLSLEANAVAYLLPKSLDEAWLTATTRLQTELGRFANFRAMDTRLVEAIDQVEPNERLILVGTPASQPAIGSLDLPLAMAGDQLLDGRQQPLPADVGVLMLASDPAQKVPVLIASGNGAEGVAKAVQFLVQAQDRKIGTGQVIFVDQVTPVESPPAREWRGYLPEANSFQLKDLSTFDNQPMQDVIVRGSHAPALEFDFRALPDDEFLPGSTMTLRYSYGPQINPLTSLVEVLLDGVAVGGARLTEVGGEQHKSLKLDLPADRIRPNSKIQVNFLLDPRERRSCSRVTDQQLWGTIHTDTQFNLQRQTTARLPDLKLLQTGFPFATPQDLSNTTIVLPNNPSKSDLQVMLQIGERLGRLSKSDSIQMSVYRSNKLPEDQRSAHHLIAIGTEAQFPFPEVMKDGGFAIQKDKTRQWQQSRIQVLPDNQGMVKQIISPWNRDRVLLALSGQTETGLNQVRDFLAQDPLFFQLQGDTVLISANQANASPYNANDYSLEFLQQTAPRPVKTNSSMNQVWQQIQRSWYFLAPAIVIAALTLYGIIQLFLRRLTPPQGQ
ncbi:MAG TPA: cellulose biosynthesis cyclic di-GMP-binding regulatory protein BcsB [Trichocoleus sp.]|jgi:hypothetical protein